MLDDVNTLEERLANHHQSTFIHGPIIYFLPFFEVGPWTESCMIGDRRVLAIRSYPFFHLFGAPFLILNYYKDERTKDEERMEVVNGWSTKEEIKYQPSVDHCLKMSPNSLRNSSWWTSSRSLSILNSEGAEVIK